MVMLSDPWTLLLLPVLKTKLPTPLYPLNALAGTLILPVTMEFALTELSELLADRSCVVTAMPLGLAPPLIWARSEAASGSGSATGFASCAQADVKQMTDMANEATKRTCFITHLA